MLKMYWKYFIYEINYFNKNKLLNIFKKINQIEKNNTICLNFKDLIR